jgi:hypothetical protein
LYWRRFFKNMQLWKFYSEFLHTVTAELKLQSTSFVSSKIKSFLNINKKGMFFGPSMMIMTSQLDYRRTSMLRIGFFGSAPSSATSG